ncbi:MAG: hypothetical protein CM15mP83_3200 [Flavobacteriaceae bacterium]|nr:MAG: hypothetical protein CM15mP83_3200 [Flavobacteriaceae bacterium]
MDASLYADKNHLLQGGLSIASYRFDDVETEKPFLAYPSITANLGWTYNNNGWKVLIEVGVFCGRVFCTIPILLVLTLMALLNWKYTNSFIWEVLLSSLAALSSTSWTRTIFIIFESMRLYLFYEPAAGRHILFFTQNSV